MSETYRVLILGRGLKLSSGPDEQLGGFYATVFVQANDSSQAELAARANILEMLAGRLTCANDIAEQCLIVEDTSVVAQRDVLERQPGLVWFKG